MTNNNDYFKDETSGNERASLGNDSSTREFNNVDFNKTYNNNTSITTTTTTTTTSTSPDYSNNNNDSNNNNNSSIPNNDDLEFANQLKSVQRQIDSNNSTGFVLNNVDTILSNMPKNNNNNNSNNSNNNKNNEQFNNNTSNVNKPINFNFNSNNNNRGNDNNTFSINDNDIENQNDFGEDYDLPNAARTTSQDYSTYSNLRKNANIIKVCAFLLMAFSFMTYFTQAWWLIFSFGIFACPLGIYASHNLLKYPFTIFIGYLLVDILFRTIYLFTHLSYLRGFGIFLTLLTLSLEGYFTYFCRQFQIQMPVNGRVTYREFYLAMGNNGIFDC